MTTHPPSRPTTARARFGRRALLPATPARLRAGVLAASVVGALACGRTPPGRPDGGAAARDTPPPAPPAPSGALPTSPPPAPAASATPDPCVPPPGLVRRRPVAGIMSASGSAWLDRADRERIEPRKRILDALGVAPGNAIADVGAGTGYYTVELARRVGAQGRVVATDVQPEMLKKLEAKARAAGLANVETRLATEADAGLGRGAFDLALMVDVYHELARPFETLAQIRCALNDGGRLVLLEYRAEDPAVAIRPEHKMRAEDVVAEVEPVGFRLGERLEFLPEHRIFVFAKAPPAPGAGAR